MKQLHEYQKNVVKRVIKQKKVALWLDMGLGKTIIVLTAIQQLMPIRVLVVAPKTVTESVWMQEAMSWPHTQSLRVSRVIGTEAQRLKALRADADIYVISRDNLHWLFLQEWFRASMLVVDESTSIKDRSTRRWASICQKSISIGGKKCHRRTAMIDMFDRVVLLSGTPCSESYAGLWAQIYLLDRGERLGRTIGAFRQRYMIPQMYNGWPVYQKMRPGAIDAINRQLSDICISMVSEDYLTLPERIDVIRWIDTVDRQYNDMSRDGVMHVDDVDIIAGDTLTRYTKLQQICSGHVYDESSVLHRLNSYKEDVLEELLEGTDEPVLIAYKYQFELDYLKKIGGTPLTNPATIESWNKGDVRIGLIHPASGGRGLNLASGGSVLIWYSLPLSLEDYLQTNKRLHRQGQSRTVRIYHLLTRGTIDEHIYRLLQDKQSVLDGLMCYFKEEEKGL